MASHGIQMVEDFGRLLQEMLSKALEIKPTSTVDPPLSKSDLPGLFAQVDSVFSPITSLDSRKHAIETAARESFNDILATTTIESPSFVNIWNLLDILSILSDEDQTEPAVLFWLVEELLESQTIAGCRKIFDYLESRRERIIAKNFGLKNLVILRSCNELLRRLSRAEDTAFCGRVFIFLFQSFPLGDKSSVNLRGEYHVENVTTFDVLPTKQAGAESMDVDTKADSTSGIAKKSSDDSTNSIKGVTFSKPLSADDLYPVFWALQQSFSQPKKLFDATHFLEFKAGLESTMVMFKSVQTENSGRSLKTAEEGKRGTKRKRGQGDDDLANAFNPKYLTSRDLFELEISDLSFRRHVIVQALIVIDFLLSLSSKAKEKLLNSSLPDNVNKSVMYADQVLNDEDTKWALEMKRSIAEYLKQGSEGPYFYRMVETVLSRDKNWARWKIESCPSIAKPAVTPKDYLDSKNSARKATTNKRLRSNLAGSLDLKFLSGASGRESLDRLKDPVRYQLPSVKSFKSKIELDDMDIEMAMDDESKNTAIESKASKSWRAQRIASTTKLAIFDKIERSDKIDVIFQDHIKPEEPASHGDEAGIDGLGGAKTLKDRRPIVISGPKGVGKGTLVDMLLTAHKTLSRNISHTTRPPQENEIDGIKYHFIDKEKFNVMRDGDQFLEHTNFRGNEYGTSRKVVESIVAQSKVPVLELDMNGIQQLKDQGYDAHFIFIAPPSMEELEARLGREPGHLPENIQEMLKIAEQEIEKSKVEGFYDKVIVNETLDTAYKSLENFISADVEEKVDVTAEVTDAPSQSAAIEVEMTNDDSPTTEAQPTTDDTPGPQESIKTDTDPPIVTSEGDGTAK